MVTLPQDFIATRYPGYFWNEKEKALYSLKSGVLSKLIPVKPSYWNDYFHGYRVSVKGIRRCMSIEYLNELRPDWVEIAVKR